MNTTITLSLNAREGNPRNSEGSFITLKRIPGAGHLLAVWNDHSRAPEQRSADWVSSSWGRTPMSYESGCLSI